MTVLRWLRRHLPGRDRYPTVQMEHWTDPNLGGHAYRLQDPPPKS